MTQVPNQESPGGMRMRCKAIWEPMGNLIHERFQLEVLNHTQYRPSGATTWTLPTPPPRTGADSAGRPLSSVPLHYLVPRCM